MIDRKKWMNLKFVFQDNFAAWMKSDQTWVYPVGFNIYKILEKCKLVFSDRKCYLVGGVGRSERQGLKKGIKKLWVVMGTLLLVNLVVVSQVCMCVRACRIVHYKYVKCIVKWLDTNKAVFEIVSRKRCPICPCSVSYLPYQLLVVKDDHIQSCSCSAVRPLLG